MPKDPTFTWLGHAAVRVETTTGKTILIDPWLENPKAPKDAMMVKNVDAILVTHGHNDHLGNTVQLAKQHRCVVVAIHEVATYLESLGLENVIGMNKGGTFKVADCDVTMVNADHSGDIGTDEGMVDGGEAAGFVVKTPDGTTFYHSGDTNVFGDMKLINELYEPQVGFVCIGGHYTMGPREAAHAVKLLGLRRVVPIHFGTFPMLKGTPEELRRLVGAAAEVTPLTIGTPTQLSATLAARN